MSAFGSHQFLVLAGFTIPFESGEDTEHDPAASQSAPVCDERDCSSTVGAAGSLRCVVHGRSLNRRRTAFVALWDPMRTPRTQKAPAAQEGLELKQLFY
jgi:hypothetical protein